MTEIINDIGIEQGYEKQEQQILTRQLNDIILGVAEKRNELIKQQYGNCLAMFLSLSFLVLLEDLNDCKERLLTSNLELDIDLNQQTKSNMNRINVLVCLTMMVTILSVQVLLENPVKHRAQPLTFKLEHEIFFRWIRMTKQKQNIII